ncbi:glycosyltransferase family 2 protein [Paenibacillus eucommiae]|uniref:Glycosyltransferase involved in cell wall biosynthesis n=1 Tax=Paenibacillus eucommiae TaxID=1355755 RepID=A0ABS4J8K7_9BACL|nr:glycosyltransferase family A protein [Paenibacillus eucommiae]MBP1995596.1 glycosyltransferase involved in cell wall biosynthesis [Paenibacillus eucommiae]
MPTFQRAAHLKEVIPSILNQTFQDFEIIIVDNHSTDDTAEIVASFKDERIHFYQNERNIGAARNHNRCLLEAKGTYIKFLHSDDRFTTNRALEKLYEAAILYPEAGLLTCGAAYPSMGKILTVPFDHKRTKGFAALRESMTVHNFGLPSDWLFKREILPYTGLLIDSHVCDCDFVMKAVYYYDCYSIAEPLIEHLIHDGNETLIANRLNGWEAMRFKALPSLPFYSELTMEMKAVLSNYLHMSIISRLLQGLWQEAYPNLVLGVLDLLKLDPHLTYFQGEDRQKLLSHLLELLVDRSKPSTIYEFMVNQTFSKPYSHTFLYGFAFNYQLYSLTKKLKPLNKKIVVYGDTADCHYVREALPELKDLISEVMEVKALQPEQKNAEKIVFADGSFIPTKDSFLILADMNSMASTRYQLQRMGLVEGQHFLPTRELF